MLAGMSIPKVGDVFALPLRAGGFGACQVIADHGDTIELMGFAPIFDAAPTLAQVLTSPPLELTHHFHKGGIERTRVAKAPMPSTQHRGTWLQSFDQWRDF